MSVGGQVVLWIKRRADVGWHNQFTHQKQEIIFRYEDKRNSVSPASVTKCMQLSYLNRFSLRFLHQGS